MAACKETIELRGENDWLKREADAADQRAEQYKAERDRALECNKQLKKNLLWWNERFCCQVHAPEAIKELGADCEAYV